MQLLLVEDSETLVKVISHFMDELFDEIVSTSSIEGALLHLATNTPDVIWLDLTLPDSTVGQTMNRIPIFRNMCPHSTIVVMSGVSGDSMKQKCLDMGADAFLSKAAPIKAAQIIGLLAAGCLNRIQGNGLDRTAELMEKVTDALIKLVRKPTPPT